MTEPIVTYNVTEPTDKDAEIERLRMLIAMAEAHAKCRFAMVTFPENVDAQPVFIVTTSSSEPTDYERHLIACSSHAALDRHAAFHAGTARGISEVCRSIYGDPEKVPKKWTKRVHELAESVTRAAFGAVELQRIAVAPFGLQVQPAEGAYFWRTDKDIAADEPEDSK